MLLVTSHNNGWYLLWQVTIYVYDLDDNAPAFSEQLYRVFIDPMIAVGSTVFTPVSYDGDLQNLTYWISNGNEDGSSNWFDSS